jgi:hypothetical protein
MGEKIISLKKITLTYARAESVKPGFGPVRRILEISPVCLEFSETQPKLNLQQGRLDRFSPGLDPRWARSPRLHFFLWIKPHTFAGYLGRGGTGHIPG